MMLREKESYKDIRDPNIKEIANNLRLISSSSYKQTLHLTQQFLLSVRFLIIGQIIK